MPGEVAGVYSGSTFLMPTANGDVIPWISASVPTNDMMIFAYPYNSSDPKLVNWSWYEANPVIYSPNASSVVPPGRDPTEVWECTSGGHMKLCMAFATQQSEGCPCSGISGIAVFSATYEPAPSSSESTATPGTWSSWQAEGYLAEDDMGAVMWECPDLFPLNATGVWLMKYSIGPGPSFDQPWGTVGPRDYYVTGNYNPTDTSPNSAISFEPDASQWLAAMNRSTLMSLDVGAFYASKSYKGQGGGRLLWGWLPEERQVDAHGNPYGWAGAMSFPREVIPYRDTENSPWYVRTPPLQSALEELRVLGSEYEHGEVLVDGSTNESSTAFVTLPVSTSGSQLELLAYISVTNMSIGDVCGLRVLSSVSLPSGSSSDIDGKTADGNWDYEYTDIGILFTDEHGSTAAGEGAEAVGAVMYVDPARACSNMSSSVNRTQSSSYVMNVSSEQSYYVNYNNGGVELHVIIDHSIIEAFAAQGIRAATRRVYPSDPNSAVNVQLFGSCGSSSSCQCKFSSIWSSNLRAANITVADYSAQVEDSAKQKSSNNDNKLSESELAAVISLSIVFCIGAILCSVYLFYSYRKRAGGDESPLASKL